MKLIRRRLNVRGLLAMLLCLNASVVAYAQDDDQAHEDQDNLTWPTLPSIHLALVEGFETEAEYIAKTASRIAEFEREAALTSDQQQKVDLLFATVNQILAFQLEPAISRQLLGLEEETKEGERVQPSTMLAHVREMLATSEAAIESYGQGELSEEQKAWHSQVRRQLRLLQGFAAGVEVLTNAELDQASVRDAASRLSILREDSDKSVMAAAGFWQAIVRNKMADPVRALDVLPLALAEVRKESLAHSFFARILRCELLAGQDRYAASLALLTDIEELCDDWFDREADRAAAARTAAWMQLKVLKRWRQSLMKLDSKAEAQWCVQRASSIIERRFSGDDMSLLRLTPAVPIVVTSVEVDNKDSASNE